MKTKKTPAYWEMTQEELAEATREFEGELQPDTFRPLGPEKQLIWQRLQEQEKNAAKKRQQPRKKVKKSRVRK